MNTPSRREQVIYWSTTGLVGAAMLLSAFNFALNPEMRGAFAHLGLPHWFKVELTVAKAVGAIALVLPWAPRRIKEFAYFGFAITISSACIAHLSSGDGLLRGLEPLVALGLLAISYRYFLKRPATGSSEASVESAQPLPARP